MLDRDGRVSQFLMGRNQRRVLSHLSIKDASVPNNIYNITVSFLYGQPSIFDFMGVFAETKSLRFDWNQRYPRPGKNFYGQPIGGRRGLVANFPFCAQFPHTTKLGGIITKDTEQKWGTLRKLWSIFINILSVQHFLFANFGHKVNMIRVNEPCSRSVQ